ncbi:MAG: response regulator [Lachnospiraceae bacterium]|nr:response regulator [Lachnospiraceae bacterium]
MNENSSVAESLTPIIDYLVDTDYDIIGSVNFLDNTARMMYGEGSCTKPTSENETVFEEDYEESLTRFLNNAVIPEEREEFRLILNVKNIKRHLEEQGRFETSLHVLWKDGSVRAKKLRYFKMKNRMDCCFVTQTDITDMLLEEERKRQTLQNALTQAKYASEAKTTFLSNMSHDIRTPMNAIIGFTAIAAGHINETEVVTDCLEKIMTSSNHLLQLINDVLDMSRIESGKMQLNMEPCNLATEFHDLVDMVQTQIQAKQIDLYVDTLNVKDENVITDPMKFNQIFLNIIGNAIKFNKTGGMVSVRIEQKPSKHSGYSNYLFTIKDTGKGISREFLEKIFQPFERENTEDVGKIEGTGLGLAIVKNIVDMMNGEISVTSELGKGTEFRIELPLELQTTKVEEVNLDQLKGLRALVVDDDFNTCDSVSAMLREIGMEPEWTLTGKEAVLKAKQAYKLMRSYSAFIIDWIMPDMNGIEVTRRIRSVIGDETPIFILTAYDWLDLEEEAKEAGVTAFCRKPLFISDLRRIMLKSAGAVIGAAKEEKKENFDFGILEGKKILLAEDNLLNLEIAARLLKDKDILVDTAENGRVAVDKFTQSKQGEYDLILMDVRMPVLDGYQATETIRAMSREDAVNIPIIALTANAYAEDIQHAKEAGMNAHLSKPIVVDALYETIAQFF